jgi:hypothetical protein
MHSTRPLAIGLQLSAQCWHADQATPASRPCSNWPREHTQEAQSRHFKTCVCHSMLQLAASPAAVQTLRVLAAVVLQPQRLRPDPTAAVVSCRSTMNTCMSC